MMKTKDRGRLTPHLAAAALVLAAFSLGVSLRLIPLPNFLTPEGVYFLEGDNYEHLRKIVVILHDFPYYPPYDYYLGYPVGSGTLSSPLFDITAAALLLPVLWLVGWGGIESAAAFLPPVAGMLAVIPLFLWCRECFGQRRAAAAAFILAVLPPHIFATVVSRLDNEMFEPLWAGILFYGYTVCCREAEKPDGGQRRLVSAAVLTGLAAALSILYWRGALIWWAIVAGHNLWAIFWAGYRNEKTWKGLWLAGAVIFGATAGVILAICLTGLWGLGAGVRFNVVSWFHLAAALLAISASSSLALVFHMKQARGWTMAKAVASGAVVFLVGGGILAAALPSFFYGILGGYGVIGGENVWTSTIAQYQPLFFDASGRISLQTLKFSTLYLAVTPVILIVLSNPWKKWEERTAQTSFFIFAGLALFVLTVMNTRYENVLALVVAACGALFLAQIYDFVFRRAGMAAGYGAALLAGAAMLLPAYSFYRDLPRHTPFMIRGSMQEALVWIRLNTPATSHFLTPHKKPEYGVMARWEYGGWIEYVAERPAIATLFGSETHGLKESAALFLSTDETKFLGIMDAEGARYLILSKTLGALPDYARLLGRETSGYFSAENDGYGRTVLKAGPKFFDLVHIRLYLMDGQPFAEPVRVNGVPGMRLVYESAGESDIRDFFQEIKEIKVFERVPGAVIRGHARPGERVFAEGIAHTNRDRAFYVSAGAFADAKGVFELRVYYPSKAPHENGIGVAGPYTVRAGQKSYRVTVTENAVTGGDVIETGRASRYAPAIPF